MGTGKYEGLEVVGWHHSHAEVATSDKARVVTWLPECVEPLCRLSDAQRAIAELREECKHLKDCQENAMLHMTGLVAERDTLRQQLAERDAEILEQCRLNGMGAERELKLIAQRDKLAGLLRHASSVLGSQGWDALTHEIDAALAEVKPCQESPHPAAT